LENVLGKFQTFGPKTPSHIGQKQAGEQWQLVKSDCDDDNK